MERASLIPPSLHEALFIWLWGEDPKHGAMPCHRVVTAHWFFAKDPSPELACRPTSGPRTNAKLHQSSISHADNTARKAVNTARSSIVF